MIKRIKAYMALPKGEKHYARWFAMNYEKLYRLKIMTPHQAVILNDYTDEEIEEHGIRLLYILTKDLAMKPSFLYLLHGNSIEKAVLIYNHWTDLQTIKNIINEI